MNTEFPLSISIDTSSVSYKLLLSYDTLLFITSLAAIASMVLVFVFVLDGYVSGEDKDDTLINRYSTLFSVVISYLLFISFALFVVPNKETLTNRFISHVMYTNNIHEAHYKKLRGILEERRIIPTRREIISAASYRVSPGEDLLIKDSMEKQLW